MATYPPKDVVAALDSPTNAQGGCVPFFDSAGEGDTCVSDPSSRDACEGATSSQDVPEGDANVCALCTQNARAHDTCPRARIAEVTPETPADDAGFEPGCYILSVDGHPVRDLIDWRWLTTENDMVVGYIDLDGDEGFVELEREEGEEWGFAFEGVVFDGIRQCRNACTFCFMRQLPPDMRPSLSLRDDDYRLSFLSGTFVTFTNLTPDEEARIIQQHISPLRVSLHARDEQTRLRMIGKHAMHGIEVLDRLLAAGIEFHAQIVLVPGENDGEILQDTLQWAYARPGILDICIVPLGYTKHQTVFDHSYNKASSAQEVIDLVRPFQEHARSERGYLWVYPADEFYRNAFREDLLQHLPPASDYGDFGMFEDGVGIIRTFVDDWNEACQAGYADYCATVLCLNNTLVHYVAGYAMQEVLTPLLKQSALTDVFQPLFVKNTFFGGNVDVTGLLCGCDIVNAVQDTLNQNTRYRTAGDSHADITHRLQHLFVLPRVMFNDNAVTLDDMSLQDMEKATGARLAVVSCNASDFLKEIVQLVTQ